MADFTKVVWNDQDPSTALTAARGPRRWEDALEELGADVDFLADQVAALSPAGTGGGTFLFGTSAQRPNPEVGLPYWDTTLNKLIVGDGSIWRNADGTAVSGGGGTVSAPTNLAFTRAANGDIVFTWTAVAGSDTYKLYEDGSPSGVAGKTALTGTTTALTAPTAPRTYNYWLTNIDGGVESSISNKVTVVISATGGGNSTPAQILNIGSGSTQNYVNVGIGYASGHVDKTMAQIIGGYDEVPYFTAVSDGGIEYVQFQVFMNGGRTSTKTKYPRSEMRELLQNGTTKAAWDATDGQHEMWAKHTLKHLQPNKQDVTVGQIHDDESDALSLKVINRDLRAVFFDSVHPTVLYADWDDDEEVSWKISVLNGTTKIYINDVLKITSTALASHDGNVMYFKAGAYPQSHATAGGFESPTEYCRIWMRDFRIKHTA